METQKIETPQAMQTSTLEKCLFLHFLPSLTNVSRGVMGLIAGEQQWGA